MLTMFGKLIRKIRIDNDEKSKGMADKLGVTVAYLSAVENGKRKVPDFWIPIIIEKYNLEEDAAQELQKAAYEEKDEVKIDLRSSNIEELDLALSFARRFNTLEPGEIEEIQQILGRSNRR